MNNKNKTRFCSEQSVFCRTRKAGVDVKNVFISMCMLIGMSLFCSQASAGLALPSDVVLQGEGVTITETAMSNLPGFGQYSVNNDSPFPIFAIAVSNNNTSNVTTQSVTASDGGFIAWDSQIINSSLWNSTNIFDVSGALVGLNTFGVFTDFFLENDSVNLYYAAVLPVIAEGSAIVSHFNAINSGAIVDNAFFFTPGLPDSTGVAFTTNGAIMVSSTVVPVPAAFWLLGTGVMGLLGYRRKKVKI